MKIIVCPDKFKGSLTAVEACYYMEQGIKRSFPSAEVVQIPLADGGDGTLATLINATTGKLFEATVQGPLGQPVTARWGLMGDQQTAVIEMAEASGLHLLAQAERDPLVAHTFGTGELILEALNHGCKRIVLGLGGSATNDGGMGMAAALGARFLDHKGKELQLGGAALSKLEQIDLQLLDPRLHHTEFIVASDVSNPLCGQNGATYCYGLQKGATHAQLKQLDDALRHYGNKLESYFGIDIISRPGSGAAGGLGAAAISFLNAKLISGIDLILDLIDFNTYIETADLIITGEGCTDRQTLQGKVPYGVAKRAARYNKPVVCLSGSIEKGYESLLEQGITACFSIMQKPQDLTETINETPRLLCEAAENIVRLFASKR